MAFSANGVACGLLLGLLLFVDGSSAQLSTTFHFMTCPLLFPIVRSEVERAVAREKRMGASLVRLHFHDCFVNGCDGSILLDDTTSFRGEKTATPNRNSARGFNEVDDIKSAVEKACPGVVSCADILAIAARDSVAILGGPSWDVKLGRRDAKTASRSAANNDIPSPTSNLNRLISSFQAKGLSTRDMVALSGSHTIGQARCTFFRTHIYNETNIENSFAKAIQSMCPRRSGSGDNNLAALDFQSPNRFDNDYYKNLMVMKGLLRSDQELFNRDNFVDSLVRIYGESQQNFFNDFALAMIKMGDISPLVGSQGEIRMNCRKVN